MTQWGQKVPVVQMSQKQKVQMSQKMAVSQRRQKANQKEHLHQPQIQG
jgi:hypothetical protein